MATLSYQNSGSTGTTVTFAAAAGGGDKVRPNDRGALLVRNDDASPVTVTMVVPGSTKYSQAEPDVAVSVAAGAYKLIGPFPKDLAGGDGLVAFTYSGVTDLFVAAVAL